MSHELVEKIAGLASRVNNLTVSKTGSECRQLLEAQDRLIKIELVAIVKDLDGEKVEYKKAIDGLNKAIQAIEDADKGITKVAVSIKRVAQAIDFAAKAVGTTALIF